MSAICVPTDDVEDLGFETATGICLQEDPARWRLAPGEARAGDQAALYVVASEAVRAWAQVFNAASASLFGESYLELTRFVTAVSALPQVSHVVLFEDEEQTHIWIAIDERDYDLETRVLDAALALEDTWRGRELDFHILACGSEELSLRVPPSYVSLYQR